MPASNVDLYHNMQESRNNFDAMRPAPVCADANLYMGQCQNVHISTNCYYGYQDPKISSENAHVNNDCEMLEVPNGNDADELLTSTPKTQTNPRKRSADDTAMPLNKRFREEVQKEKTNAPETTEIKNYEKSEDLLESLYWNIHGGNIYQLLQCL